MKINTNRERQNCYFPLLNKYKLNIFAKCDRIVNVLEVGGWIARFFFDPHPSIHLPLVAATEKLIQSVKWIAAHRNSIDLVQRQNNV